MKKEIDMLCPHCVESFATEHVLDKTDNFLIVCDANPLIEGHILIIPREHISCVGEFSEELREEYRKQYDRIQQFVKETYGSVSTFEHGIIGQTVYHAHTHILPFTGSPEMIVPEGVKHLKKIFDLNDITDAYKQNGKYLYFSIENQQWLVDTVLGSPRFFRDRFATALGVEGRGDWKKSMNDPKVQSENSTRIRMLEDKWRVFNIK